MVSIGVVVLTLNAEKHLVSCLTPILRSPLNPQILIIDSSSTDRTLRVAESLGVKVFSIKRSTFNHGKTRELARKQLSTDIVVFLTPDAYAKDEYVLGKLVQPLLERKASLAYARQIPHAGARFFEAFPREFNYPPQSELRSIADLQRYGSYLYFCSDSCAAYLNDALDEIQGFRSVILGEDTLAAAELLKKGHKIAYVAEAEVKHSHNYSLREEFCRYFDTGLMRKEYESILHCGSGDHKRGSEFSRQMLQILYKKHPHLLPYGFFHLLSKWAGYKIGQKCLNAPRFLKKAFSSQKYYWEENAFS